MLHIHTTDNNLGKTVSQISQDSFTKNHFDSLLRIANFPLSELCATNPDLLVFPPKAKDSFGKIDDQKIFEMSGNAEKLADVKIKTGNLMGFLGTGENESEVQMQITSRFTKDAKIEDDFFLHYMLCRVYAPNLLKLPTSFSLSGTFEILCLLFSYYLKRAMNQGIFQKYQTFEKNDANVRGVINVPRHIRQNIPFAGKVAYTERTRATDNFLTELVRHTIEAIKTNPIGKIILSQTDTKPLVSQIVELTPSYNFFARGKIISKNLKTENHPFFTEWKNLQKLCLAILRHNKVSFSKNSKKIHGLLFDGAWLWEEYLATILKPLGFVHPENRESRGGLHFFDNDADEAHFDKNYRKIYPDFYRKMDCRVVSTSSTNADNDTNAISILDAKYKHLENGAGREDLYQVVSYIHTMSENVENVLNGGFVYPEKYCSFDVAQPPQKSYKLSGLGGGISVIGLKIPQNAATFSDFCDEIKKSEKDFASVLCPNALGNVAPAKQFRSETE